MKYFTCNIQSKKEMLTCLGIPNPYLVETFALDTETV